MDFLTKKRVKNEGEIQKYYVEDDHDAIIEPWVWECVQLETEQRKRYMQEHGTNSYSHNTENNPFVSKIVCGNCNKVLQGKAGRAGMGLFVEFGNVVSDIRSKELWTVPTGM